MEQQKCAPRVVVGAKLQNKETKLRFEFDSKIARSKHQNCKVGLGAKLQNTGSKSTYMIYLMVIILVIKEIIIPIIMKIIMTIE